MDGKLSGSINGADYELAYDADNCKALFLSLLDQVDGICRDGDEIFDAVMNTANSYFAGDKPLEQAADDIAKRLRISNAEHSYSKTQERINRSCVVCYSFDRNSLRIGVPSGASTRMTLIWLLL